MIITPPVMMPAYEVSMPTPEVRVLSDAEFKKAVETIELCKIEDGPFMVRQAADDTGLLNNWYIRSQECNYTLKMMGFTQGEYSNRGMNKDGQDVLEYFFPVTPVLPLIQVTPVLPLLPVPYPPHYSDFPSIYLASN